MKLQLWSSTTAVFTVKARRHYSSQGNSEIKLSFKELISRTMKRKWMLPVPDTKIHQVMISPIQGKDSEVPFGKISFRINPNPELGNKLTGKDNQNASSFYVLRDDLLHPLINGNKARKLDALLPLIVDHSVTDVVTCGGCQSAHTAAVAVSCAEAGIRSHLLLRGEQPEVLTGYNLISTLYGNVTYVPRHLYANRDAMLKSHAKTVTGNTGHILWCDDIIGTSCASVENYGKKVLVVNEGAGDTVALLGVIRLMQYLCQDHLLGKERRVKLVVDTGTGTTAIGLGLGALCLGLPWEVTAITLADPISSCIEREKHLISTFKKKFSCLIELDGGLVNWVERNPKRKFGKVLEGEIETCQKISRETGILIDPVYTLAAWELATRLSLENPKGDAEVVMLHTGGTLGMFGLAQRYKTHFNRLKDT